MNRDKYKVLYDAIELLDYESSISTSFDSFSLIKRL